MSLNLAWLLPSRHLPVGKWGLTGWAKSSRWDAEMLKVELVMCQSWENKHSGASQVALVVKNPPANAGDVRDKGLIPGLGRSPRAGHGNPLQYSCLENPMDRRARQTTVHGVTKSRTQLRRLRTCAPTNTRIQDQTKNTSGFQDGPWGIHSITKYEVEVDPPL